MGVSFRDAIPCVWPLTADGLIKAERSIVDEVHSTISELNSREDYPYVFLQPADKDIRIDRIGRKVTAMCRWIPRRELRWS
ncbi:hypothetical protein [Bifidobacterium sp. ESL0745]|uniref:hypothetical protein n=1 Tax=Bifidobacterium sp. ESL0745 TaxID=2983226 RepID=UPI0023F7680E|nr:hypothetical protein [Bifidobacterium sp. ESL0745]MDF7665699.1 hypothetical protein [Bifidobacterium sp. ESL0745]